KSLSLKDGLEEDDYTIVQLSNSLRYLKLYDEALNLLDTVDKNSPYYYDALVIKAETLMNLNLLNDAYSTIITAENLKSNINFLRFYYVKSEILFGMKKDLDVAIACHNKWADGFPNKELLKLFFKTRVDNYKESLKYSPEEYEDFKKKFGIKD